MICSLSRISPAPKLYLATPIDFGGPTTVQKVLIPEVHWDFRSTRNQSRISWSDWQ